MPRTRPRTRSAEIREKLDHPVIDCDGHLSEFMPSLVDYLRKVGGSAFAERYLARCAQEPLPRWTPEQRRYRRQRKGHWWERPTLLVEDAVTPQLPRLLHERLDEFGIDFSVVYPSMGLLANSIREDEDRLIVIRAVNEMHAELYNREYGDRLTVPAVVPMKRPEEALAELEHAVRTLGFRVVMLPAGVWRPIQALYDRFPGIEEFTPDGVWLDGFGLDSEYDYDPVWRKCIELGVAATCHAAAAPFQPWGSRSISNWTFNHIGNQPWMQHMLCKSLYLGGVTRRFPELNFAFLECGVGWACVLLSDTVSHWEKRNPKALAYVDPARLDRKRARELLLEYGGERMAGRLDQLVRAFPVEADPPLEGEDLDDFRHMRIERAEQLGELFDSFYFGCEADDRMNAMAFDARKNRFGQKLHAVFSSDIGHFDVPDMTRVVEEAHELVEDGSMSPEDFRLFMADNTIRLHGRMNPDFWKGTPVADYAARVLAADPARRAPAR
jgi:predicted TIM-barrel fold metal-dependent hydrolase